MVVCFEALHFSTAAHRHVMAQSALVDCPLHAPSQPLPLKIDSATLKRRRQETRAMFFRCFCEERLQQSGKESDILSQTAIMNR